jgi:hypothetical protein
LPKRRGRNEDPVGKRAKAAKAAVNKATKVAKAADKKRQALENDAAKERLVEMEIDESFTRVQEDQQRVRQRSDIKAPFTSEDHDGSGDEFAGLNDREFSGDESEESSTSDEAKQSRAIRGPKVHFNSYNASTILTVTY